MKNKLLLVVIAILLMRGIAIAQIPVEVFAGHKKVTVDIMFFRYIKNNQGQHSNFLFFNRNRASIDYTMTQTSNSPQFGFTEAVSYNHSKLRGFAPVLVTSILNKGVYPKLGIQFAKVKKNYTLFSWSVAETVKKPNIDLFILGRYISTLTTKLKLFSQVELIQAFPTVFEHNYSFTQRFRLGLKINEFQLGIGLDQSQIGRNNFITSNNFGGFIRYEF